MQVEHRFRARCRCSGNVFLPSRLTALAGFTELQLVGTALPDLPAWLAQLPALRWIALHPVSSAAHPHRRHPPGQIYLQTKMSNHHAM